MIRLLFVGDGERDAVTNPHLVKVITGADVEGDHRAWKELRLAGGGNGRKLKFAIRQARDAKMDGVVACVDQDKSPAGERLRDLVNARKEDREKEVVLPTALGCANPHAEAWLLDDAVAVRAVLQLDNMIAIPTIRRVDSPKEELHRLQVQSPRAGDLRRAILGEIAQALVPKRCQHVKQTGFAAFVDEIKHEIGPLVG